MADLNRSILGAEGYCRTCRFVVSLDDDGLLSAHTRADGTKNTRRLCTGSVTRPPVRTPVTSRLAAFKGTPPSKVCHWCDQRTWVSTAGVFVRHMDERRTSMVCMGTGRVPMAD